MTKGVKICILLICVLLVSSVILVIIFNGKSENNLVEISQDGKIIYTIDISEKDDTFRIDSPDGGYNLIEIKDGKICISEADCPDKTCVKTGWLRSEEIPIVCLPHRLVIKFADERGKK